MLVPHSLESMTREKGLAQFFRGCGLDPEVDQSAERAEYQKRWGKLLRGRTTKKKIALRKGEPENQSLLSAVGSHLAGAEGPRPYSLVLSCQGIESSPCLSIKMHPWHPGTGTLDLHLYIPNGWHRGGEGEGEERKLLFFKSYNQAAWGGAILNDLLKTPERTQGPSVSRSKAFFSNRIPGVLCILRKARKEVHIA